MRASANSAFQHVPKRQRSKATTKEALEKRVPSLTTTRKFNEDTIVSLELYGTAIKNARKTMFASLGVVLHVRNADVLALLHETYTLIQSDVKDKMMQTQIESVDMATDQLNEVTRELLRIAASFDNFVDVFVPERVIYAADNCAEHAKVCVNWLENAYETLIRPDGAWKACTKEIGLCTRSERAWEIATSKSAFQSFCVSLQRMECAANTLMQQARKFRGRLIIFIVGRTPEPTKEEEEEEDGNPQTPLMMPNTDTSGEKNGSDGTRTPILGPSLWHIDMRSGDTPSTPIQTVSPRAPAPASPSYSPTDPGYSPTTPEYSPTSPGYNPTAPGYSPTAPGFNPATPVFPGYSPKQTLDL